MAQLESRQPIKVFRGTVDEVFSHRSEIPGDATVELTVFAEAPGLETGPDELGGKSLADRILEIGTVPGLPPDLSTNPILMRAFGDTKDLRASEP